MTILVILTILLIILTILVTILNTILIILDCPKGYKSVCEFCSYSDADASKKKTSYIEKDGSLQWRFSDFTIAVCPSSLPTKLRGLSLTERGKTNGGLRIEEDKVIDQSTAGTQNDTRKQDYQWMKIILD